MQALMKKSVWFMCGLNFGVAMSVSAATLSIPNVPLQTGSDVPANIMFLLDDSGSMAWEYMPNAIANNYSAPTSKVCTEYRGNGNCKTEKTIRTGANVQNYWYYSSEVNKTYYDPNVVYQIPPNEGGTLPNVPTYTKAWMDGFDKSNSRDLSDEFDMITNGGTLRFTEGGFYYNYAPSATDLVSCNSNLKQNKCYSYVSMNSATTAQKSNFAIWYSYYRSRKLLARSGVGTAFYNLPDDVRVGYGALNDGLEEGVREFNQDGRKNFYDWLYDSKASGGTPLRRTLEYAGNYFSTDEPYRADPTKSSSALVSCRQNFSILTTDGSWNGSNPASKIGNADGDSYQITLADVASYYYKNDLRSGLTNNVPKRKTTSPNWQHMVTFGVGLGVEGTLDPEVAKNYAPNDSRWPNPNNDDRKIDDLLHAAVNGDGEFFSAKDPVTFSKQITTALKAILDRIASASNLAATTTSLLEDNSVFQASFNTASWSGTLISRDVDDLSLQWSANFPAWQSRNIQTSRTTLGITTSFPFTWDNLLPLVERPALESEIVVNYLRGDRSNEKPSGTLRQRVSILGDIAHSSPVYVGAPQNRNYQRYSWAGSSSYAAFVADKKDRAPMVYVGANDGMLHGFNADTTSSTKGIETYAYVPQKMLTAAAQLASYSKETYAHRFYVDGSPTVGDVYINGQWRSVLVSSLGRGGNSVFALDVTDPTNITLLWDLTIPELGVMTAKPVITRLNNGRWAAVMPYGYNNSTNKSGLLVIDIQNGGTPIKLELPNTAGELGQPEGWDMNRNGNADWFFAGDLNGNVWKFDLSSISATNWGVAYNNTPLFTAKDAGNKAQPITGGITLSSHPTTGELWIFFGTGKYLETGDSLNTDTQSWYGIVDGTIISNRGQLVPRYMTNTTYTNGAITEQTRTVTAGSSNDLVNKRGWYMDLIDARERVTSKARVVGTNLILNTIIPDSDLCNPQGDGWVMAIDPFSGSRLKYHLFDLSNDGEFNDSDGITTTNGQQNVINVASGLKFEGMPGEPVFVGEQMLVGDSRVSIDSRLVNLQLRRGRISWREVVN
ncbi:pilus assembly protein [Alishewanella sp. SMS8]|uniref:pilus assembly protein n=1 Tax=Alishewanella sp. SMS8 TaxID=2994676 RepID=UPI0027410C5B|nr:PilC/PilY family type IV pilus protein [Alishewanella sp. SMS8]MDP5459425.1 PilC/PilY family type IV pilus protein [Alishewanella sp. SMS8]